MWAKYIFFVGICIALAISIVVTVPYVLAWNSYNAERGEVNVVAMKGATYSNIPTTVVNISLVAVYPKAAVYASQNVFNLQLVFFVNLDSQITLFYCSGPTDILFRPSGNGSLSFYGILPSNITNSFYRQSDSGHIAPFFVNCSIPISSNQYPPPFASDLLYFTGSYTACLEIALNVAVWTNNVSANSMGFGFVINDSPVTIHCFNYPLTLWLAYGSSIVIAVSVSINYLLSRKLSAACLGF